MVTKVQNNQNDKFSTPFIPIGNNIIEWLSHLFPSNNWWRKTLEWQSHACNPEDPWWQSA